MAGRRYDLHEILSLMPTSTEDVGIPLLPSLKRRVFHITSGSSIPILAIFTPLDTMVALMATLSGIAIAVETGRRVSKSLNLIFLRLFSPLLKQAEREGITGATYLSVAALLALLLFDKPVAIAALLFLSIGDPLAALVGNRMGGPRFFGKSPVGTLAFVLASLSIASVLMATDVIRHHWAIGMGASIAALVELFPLRIDDNVTIPLISGGAMTLMLG